jgi:chromosome segregation ATPase
VTPRTTRADRADDIAAAIARFEQAATTGDHDRRLIAENLATETGFAGTAASRRQQVQQYFTRFPHLRSRWRAAVDDANTCADNPKRDLQADLTAARAEAAKLREQLAAMDLVAGLLRRKNERLEQQNQHLRRQLQQADTEAPANVVQLRPHT